MRPVTHGKEGTYRNHGCRCEACCEAKAVATAKRRKARRPEPVERQVLEITVNCRNCGGPVQLVTQGRPTDSGGFVQSIYKCTKNGCCRSWRIAVTMQSVEGSEVAS